MRPSIRTILAGDKESLRKDYGPAERHKAKNVKEKQLLRHRITRNDDKVTEPKPDPPANAQHQLKHELQVIAKTGIAIAIAPITDPRVING